MPIHLLAPDVAARIAAGEVVERPANAVKELIENGLDAGAGDIRVEIREGGRRMLRVADDGQGIPAAEVALAFQRHATSKLESASDLEHITSYGFRGEALFSIAAVSRTTLLTRGRDEPHGTQLRMQGGRLVDQGPAGAPPGTQVTVENLFYNLPARQKFLRSDATEAGQIAAVVQRLALAHPERRFSLVVDGRLTFQTPGSGDLFDVLVHTHGADNARQMIAVGLAAPGAGWEETPAEVEFMGPESSGPAAQPAEGPVLVSGAVALPSYTRANRAGIQIFVNRRAVEDRNLAHAVVQAYHTLLPVGRYPVAVLFVEVDPATLDVNVHPQKAQVRFVDERRVFRAVQRMVNRALVEQVGVPVVGQAGGDGAGSDAPPTTWNNSLWAAGSEPLPGAEQGTFALRSPAPATAPADPTVAPAYATATETLAGSRPAMPPLRVVGQIGATYIVAEGPAGMFLIDQHAAHERILYEQFLDRRYGLEGQAPARQQLLQPLALHAGSELAGAVADHLNELAQVGFVVEPFGGDAYLVRAVPSVLAGEDPVAALLDIVHALGSGRNLVGEAYESELVKMVCKRAAIKAGQLLSDIEMQELLRQLEECRSPRTCPHGRPTMIQLSAGELERAFGRV